MNCLPQRVFSDPTDTQNFQLITAPQALRIERSLEESKGEHRFKDPKRTSHKRTIQIDDALVQLLLSVRESYQRLVAGVPDGVAVDLSLIKLPADVLMFPSFYLRDFDLTKPRHANGLTKQFERHAQKMFPGLCFHDLRGSHETALLDAGVPVHVVAARCGHDPATLQRSYAQANQEGRHQRGGSYR